jgi:mannose/fructose/N-acetylgalactosamine-specific phosphotransferase system component IIC
MTIGGAASVDQGFLAYPITAVAIITEMDAGAAIALGTTVAVIAAYGNSVLRTINLWANSRYQAAINEGDKRKMDFFYFAVPLAALFVVRFIPAFLLIYVGSDVIQPVLEWLPTWLLRGMANFGNFMPAIGIALLLKFLIRERWYLAFFVFGFSLFAYLGMSVLGASVFALVIAILYFSIISNKSQGAHMPVKDEEEVL